MAYLFAHFKEKITPDGEQVYFALSKDGLNWKQVNGGKPVLTSTIGEKGCRDIEIVRLKEGGFVVLTTDLSIAYRMDENFQVNWKEVNSTGSKCLCMWKSDDLINFSQQKRIYFGRDDFGCLWAPEVIYDESNDEYMIHWGSTVKEDNYTHMSIYCCTTKDFETFSEPKLFFTKDNEILDTHIKKFGDTYHMFYKNAECPPMNMHATSKNLYGPYEHDKAFEDYMASLEKPGSYEGATTLVLPDGRWCLMLDFFGCEKAKMGYVPFVSEKPGNSSFARAKDEFSFPYGFKHGGIVEISDEEYKKIDKHYNK
ncbi:MAG: glycoside hydrolase family 43 protein [Clostridia bacterium]|nr:glycoside hydrolase family 43 protein [Clostridia bacterium]